MCPLHAARTSLWHCTASKTLDAETVVDVDHELFLERRPPVRALPRSLGSVHPGHRDPLRRRVHPLDGPLQGADRLLDVVVDNGEVEQVSVRLAEQVRLLGEPLQAAVVIGHVVEQRRRDEDDVGGELTSAQNLEGLRLHVQDRHSALLVDFPDRLQLRAVHGVLVRAVLEVLVRRNVRHHLVVGDEVVIPAVLLVRPGRPRCVGDGVGVLVRVFGYECVLNVPPTNPVSSEQHQRPPGECW